jgi:hypothetical protein
MTGRSVGSDHPACKSNQYESETLCADLLTGRGESGVSGGRSGLGYRLRLAERGPEPVQVAR